MNYWALNQWAPMLSLGRWGQIKLNCRTSIRCQKCCECESKRETFQTESYHKMDSISLFFKFGLGYITLFGQRDIRKCDVLTET